MTDHTGWRLALAQRIAASYARQPNVVAVQIAGSVGRGRADRFSDIEVDVYYTAAPTEQERIAAVEGCGGTLEKLDEDDDEWEEQMLVGGFHAASSTFLVATMERYLDEVLERYEIAPAAQTRIYSLLNAIPVKGHALIDEWRARAAHYPDGLQRAMLAEHLPFYGFWYAEDMLVERDDLVLLYRNFVEIERQIIGALLGLNRLYLPTPDALKWLDESVAAMTLKPQRLAARLKGAFRMEPAAGVAELKALIDETLTLVETHLPTFDTAPYRANAQRRRPVWDAPPPEL